MAESTGSGDSVGKISLDLEVTSDLSNQISKVSNTIGKKLKDTMDNATKNMFDGMNESMNKNIQSMSSSLKSGLDKMKQNIRSSFTSALEVLRNVKMPSMSFPKIDIAKPNTSESVNQTTTRGPPKSNIDTTALKAEMENTANELDIVNAKIEQQQAKLAMLKEEYSATFNEAGRNALEEKILKTESAINGLISKSDKLGFTLADLDGKLASAGTGAGEAASKFNLLGKITGTFGSLANGTANMTKKLNESLKGLGSSCKDTNNHMNNMHGGLSNIAKQFFTWMVILPLLMKGLGGMTSFLGSALMTNTQFANSLNQIKSNLYTAFMPIYNAILPALNSLMSALAAATAYIASFFSQLAGTTYEASFKSAQNLQYSIGAYDQQEKAAKKAANALGSAGNAAKKAGSMAKNGLAGFDEINKLSEKTPAGSGVEKPITPMANMAPIEAKTAEWVQKFKDIMGKIFDPMKQAWDNQGKATIDALKYALDSIWQLAKDIGKTFLDIWDNGTGLKICTDILKLLQTIFNIIGDIAKAFKTAWDTGNLGKQVVQALFNAFDDILKLLIDIGNTFRDVWNSGLGVEICTNILEILKNIFTIIGQIATSFDNAWNSGLGKQLITDILDLLNNCLIAIKDITSSFSKAWKSNGDTICSAILLILDDIVGVISDIYAGWNKAWEDNGAGDKLMDSLLNTLGKILTTIGDIGQGIRESLGKAFTDLYPTVIQFETNISNGLGNLADGFKTIWYNGGKILFDGIVQLIEQVGKLILQITGGAFKDFGNLFKDVLAPAIGAVFDVLGKLVDKIADFVNWINQCKPLVDALSGVLVGVGTALAGAKIAETIAGVVESFKVLSAALTFVFEDGVIAGLADIGGAIVVAVGGWPILIAAAIVGIGVVIYNHWDEIKAKTAEIWNGIKDFLSQWGTDILALITGGPIALVVTEMAKHWDDIKAKTTEIWNSVSEWLSQKWTDLKTDASTKFGDIKTYIGQKWDDVKTDTSTKWGDIKQTLSDKWGEITIASSNTWDSIKKYISDKWTEVNNDAPGLWDTISTTLSGKWNEISQSSQDIWNGIVNFLDTTFSVNWSSVWIGLANIVNKAFLSLEGMVKKPINAIIGFVNQLIDALNSIQIDIPDWVPEFGGDSFGINLQHIPALATGGVIDTPTIAQIGEHGKEAVMPLERNTGWISDLAGQIASKMGASSGSVSTSSSDSGDVIFMLDGEILGKVAIKQLLKLKKQGVKLNLT